MTVTRAQLRRRISKTLGNMLLATATGNGSTTTFVSTSDLKFNDNALVGREVYFYSGTANNLGLSRYPISASVQSSGTITFPAAPAATATGDVIEVHNTRAQGWSVQDIHDEIDGVLREASDSLPSYDREDIGTVFDQDAPTVTIPATFRAIYQVDWLDSSGLYHPIPAADNAGEPGWWVARGENELLISGDWRTWADTYTIRLYGIKAYSALSNDASTTTCNEEWLVNQVVANLFMQGRERMSDSGRDRLAIYYQDKADKRRDLLVPVPPPDLVLV